ncbi:MAG: DNA alkylation repair protein [Magnetococcales bacterium]|nr:DNA alkylation repair protein [Magnetococcales bacterium]NGZ28658.1 DNA alkylation repair protein [Magnetococcales bacterium]
MVNETAKQLKEIFHRPLVEELASRVADHFPAMDTQVFVQQIVNDFPQLSLMARSRRIAQGLHNHLPPSFPQAVAILLASLGAEDGSGGVEGHEGFRYLPFLNFVGLYGLQHPEISLAALERMTCYFSAEFDIRPFLLQYPELTLSRMKAWSHHSDWRLRRLASEGARPRLPWGMRLQSFIKDPTPCLEILEPLQADPHPVVRRSVANHLNDVSKDHPLVTVATARRWLATGEQGTRWIVGHALRTLVKEGHPQALALLGFSGDLLPETVAFTLSPSRVVLGEAVTFTAILRCREAATLSIDYALHHKRQNGSHARKVFKLTRKRVAMGEELTLQKSHPMHLITTRRYYPGSHGIDILINGRVVCGGIFELEMPWLNSPWRVNQTFCFFRELRVSG